MTRLELDADIFHFCTHLFSELGVPAVKTEMIALRPLKAHIGITIPDVPPEVVLAHCTREGMQDACQFTWPPISGGFMVNCPPKNIGIAADDQHVIFDLVFYSVTLETEAHLKAKGA